MNTSLVIPCWNSLSQLKNNLKATLKICQSEGIREFIIIDDASTDASVKFLKTFPQVTLIEKPTNEGFSSTVNLGVKKATGDIVFLLNTDAVPQKNFLKPALQHFQNPQVFSVSSNNGGNPATGYFKNGFFWHQPLPLKNTRSCKLTLWALAGNGFYRRSMWKKLDGLDSLYDPFYWEDIDLGYRALKRGWLNLWEPKSRITHTGFGGVIKKNFSPRFINTISQRNQFIFIWKNLTSAKLILNHLDHLPLHLAKHPQALRPFFLALARLPYIIPKHLTECREKRLTDQQVLSSLPTATTNPHLGLAKTKPLHPNYNRLRQAAKVRNQKNYPKTPPS